MQRITDSPRRKCPACGKLKVRRAVSHTSFVLKGSGWYVTEYGNRKEDRVKTDKDVKAETPVSKETPSPEPAAGKPAVEKPAAKSAGA